ncbi:haloacid dehalogenase [Cellvibrio zantedeschiae]|uniref:Haloacid dehalogenase-like hydrolase domain-containing protein 2 n=1 Tax=Cellvibrio zantedeschiae TaxID=1237077 RepID=A0ABQ3B954_9GAMM|nr:TIGR01458 family HAD-type hydrolase [Cellvibrio zantedeschiae]GGY80947.1 haloacid dehalogenase [Cellvibrio zantedeschiae]
MANQHKLILLDLDGTLFVGNQEIPGAVKSIAHLREQGFILRFLTNTTTKSHAELFGQMISLGFRLAPEELISAPIGAKLELQAIQQKRNRPLRIWPVVADAIKPDFAEFEYDDVNPDFVVLGDIGERWDLALINKLFNLIHGGAELIALHKNRFWQTEDGLKADIGFFVAGLEYVCSKNALIMGKPNADFFKRVLDSVGVSPAQTIMVGDDIDSDVGGAQLLGMKGCLVKTGKFRQAYFDASSVKPDWVLASIADLPEVLAAS